MRFDGTVDDWFAGQTTRREELAALRDIVRATGLVESLKWGVPCYADGDQNVILLGTLKDGCTVSFIRGALLEDPGGDLVSPGENSRSARYMRFESPDEVTARRAVLETLLHRAIELTRSGAKVAPAEEPDYPQELRARLAANPALNAAFEALTPGRRRAWHIVVSGAKTTAGREGRVTSAIPRILAGKGPNDCICGHTKRPPGCDGTHKLYT